MKHKTKRLGSQIDRATQPFPVSSYPKGYVFNIFINEILDSPEDFIEAVTALNMASSEDDVVIHLNSSGGSIDAVDTLLFEMSKCAGNIHIKASGTVASAATLILLAGHSFELSPYTNILFHSASFGTYGKSADVVEYSTFVKAQTERLMRDYYKDILSDDELHDVFENKKEFWMDSDDFCNRFEIANEKRKQEADQRNQEAMNDLFGDEEIIPDEVLNKLTKAQLIQYMKGEIGIEYEQVDGKYTFTINKIEDLDN